MLGKLRKGDKKKIISNWGSNCIRIALLLKKRCLLWVSFLSLGFCLPGNWSCWISWMLLLVREQGPSSVDWQPRSPWPGYFKHSKDWKAEKLQKMWQEEQCCPTGDAGDTQVTTGSVCLAGLAPALPSCHGFPDWEVRVSLLTVPPDEPLVCLPARGTPRGSCCQVSGGQRWWHLEESLPLPSSATPAELCPPPLLPLLIPFVCCRFFLPIIPGVTLGVKKPGFFKLSVLSRINPLKNTALDLSP